jgi:hypothetical protein
MRANIIYWEEAPTRSMGNHVIRYSSYKDKRDVFATTKEVFSCIYITAITKATE